MRKLSCIVAIMLLCLCLMVLPKEVSASRYLSNGFWFCGNGTGWPSRILETNPTQCANNLYTHGFQFALVCFGYWDANTPSAPYAVYYNSAQAQYVPSLANYGSYFQTVIADFHAKGVKCIAFIEDGEGGSMDLTAGNRQNIYNALIPVMNLGFDGYDDDIEGWSGSHQIYIDYLNNLTTFLHTGSKFSDGHPRLNMPAVAFDWQQNTNQYLHVDYICSMFYSGASTFESGAASAYFEENFGEYQGHNTPPASPLILGIMNWQNNGNGNGVTGNIHPLSWQLAQCSNFISTYGAPNLAGIMIWCYEYMNIYNAGDWAVWDAWNVGTVSTASTSATTTMTTSTTTIITSISQSTSTWTTQTESTYAYGSVNIVGMHNAQGVTFSAWIDNNAPVIVSPSGYIFTELTAGPHVLSAYFNGTTWITSINVGDGMTTYLSFDFNVTPSPIPQYLPILLAVAALAVGLLYSRRVRKT